MKLLTWNINHRAKVKDIPNDMAQAIASLSPDVVVLTEYVHGLSCRTFIKQLADNGFLYHVKTERVPGENQIFIAANTILENRNIRIPEDIGKSTPSNVLQVRLPDKGFDILGLRIPCYSNSKEQTIRKRRFWDWILEIGSDNEHPLVIIGDFNTDPDYSHARCGDRIYQLVNEGWQHAMPKSGASYWAITNGSGKRLDHAFISKHFDVLNTKYISESGRYVFAGKKPEAMSDHAVLLVEIQEKFLN